MPQRTKQRKQVGLNVLLYDRPLHPELFTIFETQTASRRAYDADIHLVEGGHLVEFMAGDAQLTEVVVVGPEEVPEHGLLDNVLCRGERYLECDTHQGVRYMISTQEEQLPATLFDATRHEIVTYATKRDLMRHESYSDTRGGLMSVLDIERRANELLVQSFHLFDDTLTVIKTQGIIEVLKTPVVRKTVGRK